MIEAVLSVEDSANCWSLGEAIGHRGPHMLHHFLFRARWDEDVVHDRVGAWPIDQPARRRWNLSWTRPVVTKPQLAVGMLAHLNAGGVTDAWVAADEVYGGQRRAPQSVHWTTAESEVGAPGANFAARTEANDRSEI